MESVESHGTQKSSVKVRDRCNTSTLGQDVNLREKNTFDLFDRLYSNFSDIYMPLNYLESSNMEVSRSTSTIHDKIITYKLAIF